MDGKEFDSIARRLATGLTRRGALRGLVASVASVPVGGTAVAAEAKRPQRCKPKEAGERCRSTKECCPKETKRRCREELMSGNHKVCCGGRGATCQAVANEGKSLIPGCCAGFLCSNKGKCVPADEA